MHEKQNFVCPILSNNCPFNEKRFVRRIQLGRQTPTSFLKQTGETVLINLMNPDKKIHAAYIRLTKIAGSKTFNYGNAILTSIFLLLSIFLAINLYFGIGK